MTLQELERLRYFSINEKDYKGRFIFQNEEVRKNTAIETMLFLDDLRHYCRSAIVLHCTHQPSGHSSKSQHYKKPSTAVDFHIENLNYTEAIAHMCAMVDERGYAKSCGFGIYPDWKSPGFHFDLRGKKARWGAMYTDKGQEYFDFEYVLSYALEKFDK